MNTITMSTLVAASIAPAALAGVVNGTLYTNQAEFNANTGATSIEDFESANGANIGLIEGIDSGLAMQLTEGDVSTMIESGDPENYGFRNTTLGGSNYLRFGQYMPGVGAQTGDYTASFSFDSSVNAFGFNLSGFQPFLGQGGFNVTTIEDGQVVEEFFIEASQPYNQARFYGFVMDSAFDEIQITIPALTNATQIADYAAIDDVVWGVPTPGATSLLAIAALGATRRRRS